MRPNVRKDRLLLQSVGDELVVYDEVQHEAHLLKASAAAVWRSCDGSRSVEEIKLHLAGQVGSASVEASLDQLHHAQLITGYTPEGTGSGSPRSALETLLAPTPAAAFSF